MLPYLQIDSDLYAEQFDFETQILLVSSKMQLFIFDSQSIYDLGSKISVHNLILQIFLSHKHIPSEATAVIQVF